MVSPDAFATAFGMSLDDLAHCARIAPSTVVHQPDDPALQAFIDNCVLVTNKMQAVSQRPLVAVIPWFHETLDVFRGLSAKELVVQGRVSDVIKYLDSIDGGYVG